ncbi:MAG: hypothetical protein QOI21_5166 [Actinomycetota bacterium]|nr:hypothetical protein [Actinomycetota bacterium]
MKRILAGVSALVATMVLAACSGGTTGGGGAPLAVGNVAASATTSASAPSSTTAPSSSETPTPSSSSSKPAPTTSKTTTSKPKPPPQADPGVPCAATVKACVDLSAHKAWLLEDGKVSYGPVAMLPGRTGYETSVGTFKIYSKEKMHLSKEFDNAPMPNSLFFYNGEAFHTGSLSVYSHGCIHLSAASSQKFYNTLSVGDKVQIVP